ncbi:uncharacterized protein LOC136749974 [Amia ocellicauda]|uniref:uncharacterized protein LOC136749974 n=1 Tax=Amia ocellicauda TaxID=2972642 RepID=UPI0034638E5B
MRNQRKDKQLNRKTLLNSGAVFISELVKLCKASAINPDVTEALITEVLHSIFFLGHIHESAQCKPIVPQDFFTSEETYESFLKDFPKAFEQYCSFLPTRTPFSILLEVVTKMTECSDHSAVLKKLGDFCNAMAAKEIDDQYRNCYTLRSTVVSTCNFQDETGKSSSVYYGASLSCSGKVETKIMIALSCIHTWDDAVAHAVQNGENGAFLQLPDGVKCRAYKWNPTTGDFMEEPPCEKCHRIFRNINYQPEYTESDKTAQWHYGNCAETECLSHLLRGEEKVKSETVAYHLNEEQAVDKAEIMKKLKKRTAEWLRSRGFRITADEIHSRFFHAN